MDILGCEEIGNLDRRILGRIRTMHGVGVDTVGEVCADGAFVSLLRIGCAHQIAVLLDGALTFQNLDHHRAGNHEIHQILEERTSAVDGIKTFRFGAIQVAHLRGNDLQAVAFKTGIDFADDILRYGIRFDDLKCTFDSHASSPNGYCASENSEGAILAGFAGSVAVRTGERKGKKAGNFRAMRKVNLRCRQVENQNAGILM